MMAQVGIHPFKLTLVKTPLIGIENNNVLVEEIINVSVTIGNYPKCCILSQTFMVIKIELS